MKNTGRYDGCPQPLRDRNKRDAAYPETLGDEEDQLAIMNGRHANNYRPPFRPAEIPDTESHQRAYEEEQLARLRPDDYRPLV